MEKTTESTIKVLENTKKTLKIEAVTKIDNYFTI